MDEQAVIAHVQRWLAEVVIGLNLCPFARRVYEGGLIRYVVSDAKNGGELFEQLSAELRLQATTPIEVVETTLLIHPHALLDFRDYNDFLDDADLLLGQLRLTGIIQIASFHPEYQFAGTDASDVANYTNRSPYPMLHLLPEASVTAVAQEENQLAEIPQRNVALLRAMGRAAFLEKLRLLAADAPKTEA